MKICPYCGKDYPDDATRCSIDGEPLIAKDPLAAATVAEPTKAEELQAKEASLIRRSCMKICPYCGKDYPDDATRCSIDGEKLIAKDPLAAATVTEPIKAEELQAKEAVLIRHTPLLVDLDELDGAFVFSEGYSRPNWKVIGEAIKQAASTEDLPDAWTEAALQWVEQVRSDLGGEYRVMSSTEFILLHALDRAAAARILALAERILEHICLALKDAVWKSGYGKHVILLFTDPDDYYQYVSYFYPEGIHPTSGGCLIYKGYVHIAMPYFEGRAVQRTLTHELVHNSLVHLPLPLWLNEGVALVLDRTATDWKRPILDHDLRDDHLAFWNSENIQRFWSGVSFGEPGDSHKLSYSLAEILVNLLLGFSKDFVAFVKQAHRNDAGQTAALDALQADLGQTVATFLGPGNWRPNRKAIVHLWELREAAERKVDPGPSPGPN